MKKNDIIDYDKENDILYFHFGDETHESAELFNGNLILDFDKKLNIVGIEIFNFMQELKKFHNQAFSSNKKYSPRGAKVIKITKGNKKNGKKTKN